MKTLYGLGVKFMQTGRFHFLKVYLASILSLLLVQWGLASWSADGYLIVLSVGVVLLYCFVLFHDLHQLRLEVSALHDRILPRKYFPRPISWFGQQIFEELQGLRYRLHSLSSTLRKEQAFRRLPAHGLPDANDSDISDAELDEFVQRPLQRALRYLQQQFRSNCACAVVFDVRWSSAICISYPQGDKRFTECLRQQLWSIAVQAQASARKPQQIDWQESIYGELANFGFTDGLLAHMDLEETDSVTQHILFWLGFSDDYKPTAADEELFQQTVVQLEHEINREVKVGKLSTSTQEALQDVRVKDEFITHISHDLRSPLANVQAILHFFRHEPVLEADHKQLIDAAIGNCENLNEIIGSVLDFAQFRSGKLTAQPCSSDLSASLANIVANYRPRAELKGLSLQHCDSSEAAFIYFDPSHAKRIINNVLCNAIKYTVRGSIVVSLKRVDSAFWTVQVKDTGVGMTADQCQQLFIPFARSHPDRAEGFGLGLALCKILTELNSGKIEVSSKENCGSTFQLHFPCANRPANKPIVPKMAKARCSGSMPLLLKDHSAAILLVDDDVDYVNTLACSLDQAGYTTLRAVSVSDALGLINFAAPAAIISDDRMPEGGGMAVLDFLAQSKLGIPSIIVSGKDSTADRQRFVDKGAVAVFTKPVEIEEIVGVLRRVVSLQAVPHQGEKDHKVI